MKCHIILFFILLPVMPLSAQEILNKAYLKCYYKFVEERDIVAHKTAADLLVLLIGPKVSKCFSHCSAQVDSIRALPNSDEIVTQNLKHAFATGGEPLHKKMKTYIYKNYPEGKMTVTDGISLQYYHYEDSLNDQPWEMRDSTRQVLGHDVQMATCNYRGSNRQRGLQQTSP